MNRSTLESRPPPQFVLNGTGKPTAVALDLTAYVALLVEANVIEPALWPLGMQEGARLLARVRAIERRCIAKHGEFDWEKLSPRLQDEYESLCARLDRMQDTGERIPLRDLLKEENEGAK